MVLNRPRPASRGNIGTCASRLTVAVALWASVLAFALEPAALADGVGTALRAPAYDASIHRLPAGSAT